MVDGVNKSQWAQTSLICAVIANSTRGRRGRPFKQSDFNPYGQKRDVTVVTDENIDELKKQFEGMKK